MKLEFEGKHLVPVCGMTRVLPSHELRSGVFDYMVRKEFSEKVNPALQRAWGLPCSSWRKSETGLASLKNRRKARLLQKSWRVGGGGGGERESQTASWHYLSLSSWVDGSTAPARSRALVVKYVNY